MVHYDTPVFANDKRQRKYEDDTQRKREPMRKRRYLSGTSKYEPHQSYRELVRANTQRGSEARKVGFIFAKRIGTGHGLDRKRAEQELDMLLGLA